MIHMLDMIFRSCLWTLNSIDSGLGDAHLCVEVWLLALKMYQTAPVAWSMTDNTVVYLTRNKVSGLRDQIKFTVWEFVAHTQQWAVSRYLGFTLMVYDQNSTFAHKHWELSFPLRV